MSRASRNGYGSRLFAVPPLWPVSGLLSLQEPEIRRQDGEEKQELAAGPPSAVAWTGHWPRAARALAPAGWDASRAGTVSSRNTRKPKSPERSQPWPNFAA